MGTCWTRPGHYHFAATATATVWPTVTVVRLLDRLSSQSQSQSHTLLRSRQHSRYPFSATKSSVIPTTSIAYLLYTATECSGLYSPYTRRNGRAELCSTQLMLYNLRILASLFLNDQSTLVSPTLGMSIMCSCRTNVASRVSHRSKYIYNISTDLYTSVEFTVSRRLLLSPYGLCHGWTASPGSLCCVVYACPVAARTFDVLLR